MRASELPRVQLAVYVASACPDFVPVRTLFVERSLFSPAEMMRVLLPVGGSGTSINAAPSASSIALHNAAVATGNTTTIGISISHAANSQVRASPHLSSDPHIVPSAVLRSSSPSRQPRNSPRAFASAAISRPSNPQLQIEGGPDARSLGASAPLVLYLIQEAPVWDNMNSEVIGRGAGLPEPTAHQFFFHLVGAVRYLHANGLICGDLRLLRIFFADQKKYLPSTAPALLK